MSILSETPKTFAQRLNQGLGLSNRACRLCGSQPPVDPADEVAASNVAQEEVKTIGRLVQPAVAKAMAGQWACLNMLRLGAAAAAFVVAAAIEHPVVRQSRAGRFPSKSRGDLVPADGAVRLDIAFGDTVGDTLKAEHLQQPGKQLGGVPASDGRHQAAPLELSNCVIEKVAGAADQARRPDEIDRALEVARVAS